MLFSEVLGQEDVKERLRRSVKDQRIPHALLLSGPEGVGKLALAVAYAQYINCSDRSDQDACGTCPSCVKIAKLVHPDLHFVFPVIKPAGKTSVICDDFIADFRQAFLGNPYMNLPEWFGKISSDAKQGMIYANESQEIIRKLNLKTYESEYKVMIIWIPEKMNISCANKLLKILEEPPAKTLFLLVSNLKEEILQTILSRSQHIQVPRLTTDEVMLKLLHQEGLELSQHDALQLARIANGNLGLALGMLKEGDANKLYFEQFVQVMRLAWQVGNLKDHASLKTLKLWSEEMAASSNGRERQKAFLIYAQKLVRENFIFNIGQTDLNYQTASESDFSRKFSPFVNERNVEGLMDEFSLAERHIEQNVNAKMVFFDLTLKIIMLLKK